MVAVWHKPLSGSIVIAGQSNARRMCDGTGPGFAACDWGLVTYAGHFRQFRSLATPANMNGKSLATHWQEGSGEGLYEELASILAALPRGVKHFLFWAQGEADAGTTAWADAYETNLRTFMADMHTESGLTNTELAWGLVRLHSGNTGSGTAADLAKVRTAVDNIATTPPTVLGGAAAVQKLIVDTVALEVDGVHWTTGGAEDVGGFMLTAANTAYGFSQRSTAA